MRPRILVIRGGAIGDFVLTLPAIRLLRENFPNVHLEILGYKHIIALAEGRYYADATRSIEYAGMSRFFIPGAELPDDLAAYFASFQQVISYLYDPDHFFETNLRRVGVKHFLHASPQLNDSAHAAQQLAQPLESLALYLEDRAPVLFPSESDRQFASHFQAQAFPDSDAPLIALHPGSGGGHRKNWPAERWAALDETLFTLLPNARLLLIGGEADHTQIATLQAAWRHRPLHTAMDLPLPALAAILQQARLFMGHDSGISHIASAAGAPSLLLFGPTDPDIWAPLTAPVKIIRPPDYNLASLDVPPVAQALRHMLESHPGIDAAPPS